MRGVLGNQEGPRSVCEVNRSVGSGKPLPCSLFGCYGNERVAPVHVTLSGCGHGSHAPPPVSVRIHREGV